MKHRPHHHTESLLLGLRLLLGLPPLLAFTAHLESKTVRVLTVGNSFADNSLTYLPAISEAAGHKLVVGKANLGGCSFERHWNHLAAYLKNPESKDGSPYSGGKSSLKDLLAKDQWDFVTIQQVSWRSHDLATYYPFARDLKNYIEQQAPNARILAHQIWAYRVDDPRFVPENEGKEPHTQQLMYTQVRQAYHTLAKELGLDGIIPSGDAMFLADTDLKWGYKPDTAFDIENGTYPALPGQGHSLHAGWSWRKKDGGTPTLNMDGHHASTAGKYLLGCVWFEVLFGDDVTGNPYIPRGFDPCYAQFLQATAHKAVANP